MGLFLGFLPEWVGQLSSILGLPAIIIAILVWALGRRDANRKLVVDEGTLKKTEFEAVTSEYDNLLKSSQADAAAAKTDAKAAKDEADSVSDRLDIMDGLYDEMRDIIMSLRGIVQKLMRKTNYEMTQVELTEFEATKPPPRPPRVRVK